MDETEANIQPRTRLHFLGLQDALVRQYLDMYRAGHCDYTEMLECLILALSDARRRLARTTIEALSRRLSNKPSVETFD